MNNESNKPADPVDMLDTTAGSVLHQLTRFNREQWPRSLLIYLGTAAITYGLLCVAALVSQVPLVRQTEDVRLPFFLDWNIAFTFIVSLPIVVLLLSSDEFVLKSALRRLAASGGLEFLDEYASNLRGQWNERFRRENKYAQGILLVLSAGLSVLTFRVYSTTAAGFWAAPPGSLQFVGVAYWFCIALLYFVIFFYCFRCVRLAGFLRDLVGRGAKVHVCPGHPDGCGGLRPIGRLGLRNQYVLTVLGLNIILVAVVNRASIATLAVDQLNIVIAIAAALYLFLGPVIFMAPLVPFRKRMRETRSQLMDEVGGKLLEEFERVRPKLRTEAIDDVDLQILERLRKTVSMIEEIPVWPFDARTLRRFGSAYVLPIAITLATKWLTVIWLGS